MKLINGGRCFMDGIICISQTEWSGRVCAVHARSSPANDHPSRLIYNPAPTSDVGWAFINVLGTKRAWETYYPALQLSFHIYSGFLSALGACGIFDSRLSSVLSSAASHCVAVSKGVTRSVLFPRHPRSVLCPSDPLFMVRAWCEW